MKNNKYVILKDAISTFGVTHQINKVIEELNELAVELTKFQNEMLLDGKPSDERMEKIAEEMGDVHVMLTQAEMIFDNSPKIRQYADAKIIRLEDSIRKEKEKLAAKKPKPKKKPTAGK